VRLRAASAVASWADAEASSAPAAGAIDALLVGDSRFGAGFARDIVRVLADADERLPERTPLS
jgi:hypothetical protein